MPHEMLAFWASALAVAMIALLVIGSHWVQRRIRADLQKQMAVAVNDEADSMLKTEEAAGGAPTHAMQSGIHEQRKAVVAGRPGWTIAFRNPARGVAVKDVMNRALGIHVFQMLKAAPAPAK